MELNITTDSQKSVEASKEPISTREMKKYVPIVPPIMEDLRELAVTPYSSVDGDRPGVFEPDLVNTDLANSIQRASKMIHCTSKLTSEQIQEKELETHSPLT